MKSVRKRYFFLILIVFILTFLFYLTRGPGERIVKIIRLDNIDKKKVANKKNKSFKKIQKLREKFKKMKILNKDKKIILEKEVYVSFPRDCLVDLGEELDEKEGFSMEDLFSKNCQKELLNLFDGDKDYLSFSLGLCDVKEVIPLAKVVVSGVIIVNKDIMVKGENKKMIIKETNRIISDKFKKRKKNCNRQMRNNFEDYISYLLKNKIEIKKHIFFMGDVVAKEQIREGFNYPNLISTFELMMKVFTPKVDAMLHYVIMDGILEGIDNGIIFHDTQISEYFYIDKIMAKEATKLRKRGKGE